MYIKLFSNVNGISYFAFKYNLYMLTLCKIFNRIFFSREQIKQSELPYRIEQENDKFTQLLLPNDVNVNRHVTLCPKASKYVLNNVNENCIEPTFISKYGKNDICDFLHSQLIQECFNKMKISTQYKTNVKKLLNCKIFQLQIVWVKS